MTLTTAVAATSQGAVVGTFLRGRESNSRGDPAQRAAEWALFDDLATQLGMAQAEIQDLRDSGTRNLREEYDARAHIGFIFETVEVLDALGWRDAILTEEDLAEIAERHAAERAAKDGPVDDRSA